jgi:glycosyltransferase involved in cell wall biosynthesis
MTATSQQLVSIVIPCYNAAPWLSETLNSALAQTWPSTEIVLVDDGSKDESLAIARRFESRGVIVATQTNSGASAARNHGVRLSRGAFIQYLDADDLLAPEKIARQMEMAGRCDPNAVLCSSWTRFSRTPADADYSPQLLSRDADPVDWVVMKYERDVMMHPAAWLVPRGLSEKAGPWNESLSLDDDGEYFTRIVLTSRGVRCCTEAVSFYRSRLAGSLSDSSSDLAWNSAFRSMELSLALLRRTEDSSRTRAACATAYQRFIYSSYPFAADCRRRSAEQVAALGGSSLTPAGGPLFQTARRLLGWRLAKRLANLRR